MLQNLRQGSVAGQTCQLSHLGGGEQHGAHFFHVQACDDRVLHIGRTGCNDLGPERTNAHKRTCGQLEIFGDTSVKLQTEMDIVGVNPLHRVATFEKAFLIESIFGDLWVSPIARGDVGTLVAHLYLVAHWHQFQAHTRSGKSKVARLHLGARHKNSKGSRLGHAQARSHHNALAHFAFLRSMQAVPNRLCQGSTRIKEHAQLAE